MKATERSYRIEDLLNEHGSLSFEALQNALEVSRATLMRNLAELRDLYHMPIVYDREAGGYRIDRQTKPVGPVQYELPGLWFSAHENVDSRWEVSPQRLVYYHHNWYLHAWCHTREALRSFSVDGIERVEVLDTPAIDVEEKLDAVLGSGYGIFSGEDIQWATLRFSPKLARWVATERWHADQEGKPLEDGSYELRLPYSEDTELVMDILPYGADCEVLGPAELRRKVRDALRAALRGYE